MSDQGVLPSPIEGGHVLVTGGAGYVGTHVLFELIQAGYNPLALDIKQDRLNDAVNNLQELTGIKPQTVCVNLLDKNDLIKVFKQYNISCVVHLAGLKAVRQSHGCPLDFYRENVIGAMNLLQVMEEFGVYHIIFASSSKVYGIPQYLPLDEKHPIGRCTNPYGRTKTMVENILLDLANADKKWRVTVLRYFNPCGAHQSGRLGEDRAEKPMNLMPIICHVALGRLQKLTIYGNDYNTADGTALKAYIHVVDLAQGTLAALKQRHQPGTNYRVYNMAGQESITILAMVKLFERISGNQIPVELCARKEGEIEACTADTSLAFKDLGWKPKKTVLEMCEDMWTWITYPDDISQVPTSNAS